VQGAKEQKEQRYENKTLINTSVSPLFKDIYEKLELQKEEAVIR
jgi:hypothetical protein